MHIKISAAVCSIIFLVFNIWSFAFGGTLEHATLLPGELQLSPGESGVIRFSAVNDHTADLASYSIVLECDAGLNISSLSTAPPAGTAKIDTRKNTITLTWEDIPIGTELSAVFTVGSDVVGEYNILPASSKYIDVDKQRLSGSCSTAKVLVRPEFVAPSAPSSIRSSSTRETIVVSWNVPPETDVAGYKIYRRNLSETYDLTSASFTTFNTYEDFNLGIDPLYCYTVSALDTYGNESELSVETCEMQLEEKLLPLATIDLAEYAIAAVVGDINGDGSQDIIFSNNANVKIYLDGVATNSPIEIISPDAEAGLAGTFGNKIALVDLNNDGFEDLVVSDPQYDSPAGLSSICERNVGKIYVYPGGPNFSTTPVFTLAGKAAYLTTGVYTRCEGEKLGFSMSAAGDVNGDGYNDVAIGVPYGGGNYKGSVAVLLGGADNVFGVNYVIGTLAEEHMGYTVSSAGDVNGDGYLDIVTGATDKAYLVWGGLALERAEAVFGDGTFTWGRPVGALDVNRDGFSDLIVSASNGLALYYGSEQPSVIPTETLHISTSFLTGLGDVNHDLHPDLLTKNGELFWGNGSSFNTPVELSQLSIIGIGDFNEDGMNDLISFGDAGLAVFSVAPFLDVPEIHVSTPQHGEVALFPTVDIVGTIAGDVTRLVIAGQDVPVSVVDGSFSFPWSLQEGENSVELIAETSNGKISKALLSQTYTTPPPLTLAITSPLDGETLHQSSILVAGTVSSFSSIVTVNGSAAILSGTTFEAEIVLLEGENIISVTVTDIYGRSTSQSITIQSLTLGTISGVVQDVLGQPFSDALVTIQDSTGQIFTTLTTPEGVFSVAGVTQGDLIITVEKDGYIIITETGNLVAGDELVFTVQLDPIPPLLLDISAPLDGETLWGNPVIVTGNVSNGASVNVNGILATLTDTSYQAEVNLDEGLNTITVVADDQYGQARSASLTVTVITQGSLVGHVTALSTGLAVEGAGVTVTDSKGMLQAVTTDINGDFLISNIASGVFSGSVTMPGYIDSAFGGTMVGGETLVQDSVLTLVPPIISDIVVESIGGDEAQISWTTDQLSNSVVSYGTTALYDQSGSDPGLVTNHAILLNGLLPGTEYHFQVQSSNIDGSTGLSADLVFTTPALPIISDIVVTNVTGSSATINWTTDQPADSFVEYGDSVAYGLAVGDSLLVNNHSLVLSDLHSGQTYHFRVLSSTSQGLQAVSADDTFATLQMFTLTISDPLPGAIIDRLDTQVKGSVTSFVGQETGVIINGVLAEVAGSDFVANHVPLLAGDNFLTVQATDVAGNVAQASVTVVSQPLPQSIKVLAHQESGLAPFETSITIDANFGFSTPSNLSYQGPGPVEFLPNTEANTYNVKMTTPGLYTFTGEVLDDQGTSYQDSVTVLAVDRAMLDALLQAKWSGMKDSMIIGDIEKVVGYFTASQQDTFREIFTITQDSLAQLANEMQNVELIYQKNNTAEYRIKSDIVFKGTPETITFYIYFQRELDGIWRIRDF